MDIICKVCSKVITCGSYGIFSRDHLKKLHNLKSKEYYDKFYLTENESICSNQNCNNPTSFISLTQGYRTYCSVKCKNTSITEINKIKSNNLEKYGTTSPTQTKEVKDKIKKTNLERYGTESTLSVKHIREKIKILISQSMVPKILCNVMSLKIKQLTPI